MSRFKARSAFRAGLLAAAAVLLLQTSARAMDLLDQADRHLSEAGRCDTGVASGDDGSGLRGWGQAFIAQSHQGSRGAGAGYKSDSNGVALGIDSEKVFEKVIFGGAVSFGHANVNGKDIARTDTNTHDAKVSVYANYDLGNDYFVRGFAGYGRGTNDTVRHPFFSAPALGSYGSDEYSALVKAGRHFGYGLAEITPSVLAHWVNYAPESYNETNAGFNNLHVDQANLSVFEVGVGLDSYWRYENRDGSSIVPALRAGVRHDFVGDKADAVTTPVGGGIPTLLPGTSAARNRLTAGASVTWFTKSNWEFRAAYDLDAKSDFVGHAATVRATFAF